jgi:hypothetical protein
MASVQVAEAGRSINRAIEALRRLTSFAFTERGDSRRQC